MVQRSLLDDVPEAILVREVGRAFVHHRRGAVHERAVDDVAVAGDPADVGGAPVDVVVAQIEDQARRVLRLHRVAARRVDHALGLAGGARRVEDEQRVLGRRARARRARATRSAPPAPSARRAARPSTPALRCGVTTRTFSTVRQPDSSAASTLALSGTTLPRRQPPSAVMSSLQPASLMRSRMAVGGEAAEDDRVRGADARAGEHRDGQLGDHRHVDGDAVAGLDAERLERVGEAADLGVELR